MGNRRNAGFNPFGQMAFTPRRPRNLLGAQPRCQPVKQGRHIAPCVPTTVQMILMQGQRLNPQRLERQQIEPETGVDPVQLAGQQPQQMRRVTRRTGGSHITAAPFTIDAVNRQPQHPRALLRLGQIGT